LVPLCQALTTVRNEDLADEKADVLLNQVTGDPHAPYTNIENTDSSGPLVTALTLNLVYPEPLASSEAIVAACPRFAPLLFPVLRASISFRNCGLGYVSVNLSIVPTEGINDRWPVSTELLVPQLNVEHVLHSEEVER
jgi:hypothetical protein